MLRFPMSRPTAPIPSRRGTNVVRPAAASIRRHVRTAVVTLAVIGATMFAVLALRGPAEGQIAIVTSGPLESGSAVDPSSVRMVLLPEPAIPSGAFSDSGSLLGRVAVRDIPARTVLTEELVVEDEHVPAGFSRVTLPLATQGIEVAGGEVVDIWGRAEQCLESACPVEQLAQGATIRKIVLPDEGLLGDSSPGYITLLVRSTQIPPVIRAGEQGSLYFVVSSPDQRSWETSDQVPLPRTEGKQD